MHHLDPDWSDGKGFAQGSGKLVHPGTGRRDNGVRLYWPFLGIDSDDAPALNADTADGAPGHDLRSVVPCPVCISVGCRHRVGVT